MEFHLDQIEARLAECERALKQRPKVNWGICAVVLVAFVLGVVLGIAVAT